MNKGRHATESYFRQAVQLHASGRGAEAEYMYREILAAEPGHADSLHMLGVLALQAAQPEVALPFIDQAIARKPRTSAYHVNRGRALHKLGRLADAARACADAMGFARPSPEAYQVLGHIKMDEGKAEDAIAAYRAAARYNPGLHDIHNNLGIALRYAGRLEDAERSLREAIRREPGEPSLITNLSGVLKELGRITEAETCLRGALRTNPNDPLLQYSLGLLMLLKGNFAEGWAGYEARARAGAVGFPPFRQPKWRGEALAGRSLLVHAEQGLGSIIQFSRYLPMVAQQVGETGHTYFQVPRPLMRLLSTLKGVPAMITTDQPPPAADLVCPLLSLPYIFGTRPETVPNEVPYLHAEPARVAVWREKLGVDVGTNGPVRGFKVGIAWQGNPASQAELGRSVPLAHFATLAGVKGVRLISLQKHDGLDQLAQLPANTPIETLGNSFDSSGDAFLDAAGVMETLDLIITTDTSIAHLAGALGRPVWLALQHVPDWRWMLPQPETAAEGPERCPWYPTMRLYRQERRGDWPGVFARIAADLAPLADVATTSDVVSP